MPAAAIDTTESDRIMELALPVLDAARAATEVIRAKAGTAISADIISGSVLSMAVQAVVMAEFSQLTMAKDRPYRAVELTPSEMSVRFFGIGQGVGMVLGGLFEESPGAVHPAMDAVMQGMARGIAGRVTVGGKP